MVITGWAGVYLDVAVILLVGVVISILSYVLGRALSRGEAPDTSKRFESGNLPEGRARGQFIMQYFPYLLMFMLMEPAFVIMFIVLLGYRLPSFIIFLASLVTVLPALAFAYREAGVIRKWLTEKA